MRKEVDRHIGECTNELFLQQYVILLNNIARSVESIIALTSLGDDAHTYSVTSGLIELICTMTLCERNKEEWLSFICLNYELGEYIEDKDKITPELKAYFQMFDFDLNKPEKVTLFTQIGWAISNSGRRCRNIKELIYAAFLDQGDEIYAVYRRCSIMTHEAYSISSIDWNKSRITLKEVSNYCCMTYRCLQELEWLNFSDDEAFKLLNKLNDIDWENA